jgi:coenzyme F420 hydrogenase subunit beta
MWQARMRQPRNGAQWTGITTALAQSLLDRGLVDAVLTVAPDPEDRWKPQPVIVTNSQDLARCRGMRMGYAPLLSLVEPALAAGHKRLAVIAIPCQVYPLRALESSWRAQHGLESLYVIGTPCSDNTTTENFHRFLALLSDRPQDIHYLEFRADYRVELREASGTTRTIPFLNLPLSRLPSDFFPLTCRTCVDYTNRLADITVGYMGGCGDQWIIVRNERGQQMLEALADQIELKEPSQAGRRSGPVRGFLANTLRAAGGLPLRRTPAWLRPLVNWLMPRVGPRGLEFARARVEMKAIESVVHLRRELPARVIHMVPDHVWHLADPYGLKRDEPPARPAPVQETACV